MSRLITAWQHVIRRSLAQWRLLSSVVVGAVLASAIMAGTVVYFDALKELALKRTLAKYTRTETDILIRGERGPVTSQEYERVLAQVNSQTDARVGWMTTGRIRVGKTPTLFLTTPGNEDQAGDDNARSYFAFLPDLLEYATVIEGTFPRPQRLNATGGPLTIEALVPADAAKAFEVGVGDRLVAVTPWQDDITSVVVVIAGLFQRNDPGEEVWYLVGDVLEATTGPNFRTVPFFISEEAFLEVLGPSFRRMNGTYAWLLQVEQGRLSARNAEAARADLAALRGSLSPLVLSFRLTTALDNALDEYDRRLFFNKLPMFVVLILMAVVILYYVVTLSSLAVEGRRVEVALLRSRGANSAQILTVFVLEGSTIAILAALAGPIVAAAAISVLGLTPAFSGLTGGSTLTATISADAYVMSALGGVLSFVALIIPAVQASRIGVTQQRQLSSRPATQPGFQRYYVDVLLLVVSIFLFRQLTEQGSVLATRLFGELVVDQMLLALPGLVLVASAMILLRLFPLAMNLASRAFSSWLPAGAVMGMWQMARNPTHYARLSLLLILTAGLGIFASSFGATLERSFRERVLYATGSDIRLTRVQPLDGTGGESPALARGEEETAGAHLAATYEQIEGVDRASPVLRGSGYDLTKFFGESYQMFAMDAESFSEVAWLEREDFSDEPMETLLKGLKVAQPPEGIVLPSDARTIGVKVKPDRRHPTVRVTARIKTAQGRYQTYRLGTLDVTGWTILERGLTFGRGRPPESSLPLTLVSLRVHETGAARRLLPGSLQIDDIRVGTHAGETVIVEAFDETAAWGVLKAAPEAEFDVLRDADTGFDGLSGVALFSWSEGSPLTARGIFHGPGRFPLPVLASKEFVRKTGYARGDDFEVSVEGHRIPAQLHDIVELFPTMTGPKDKYLIADLASLSRYANLASLNAELHPNEVWIKMDGQGEELEKRSVQEIEGVTSYSGTVASKRAGLLAQSQVDPLVQAGWRALLFIAFAAVLILSCLGFLVHAYVSFKGRELHFALLRTVGFSMRQLVTMVWIEQTLVIAVGMALGTWMGGRLGATIMPFLGHDDWGSQVLPPFAIEVNWGALLLTYGAMVAVFAIIVMGLLLLIRRISLHRILRLGEM